jgi:hypothetical protein
VHGGSPKCVRYAKAHAAGAGYRQCVVVVRTTITKTQTVYYPVMVTRTSNRTVTSTHETTLTRTYTSPVTSLRRPPGCTQSPSRTRPQPCS